MLGIRLLVVTLAALAAAAPAHGAINPLIVGGDKAPVEALPYMASIGFSGASARAGHFCGGTVITPTMVLTAAHCMIEESPARLTVTTGRTRLSDGTTGQRTGVRWISIHPGWDGTSDDLAVLRLDSPVTAAPIALSTGGTYTQSTTAGWGIVGRGGVSDELRAVELPISTTRDCRKAFGLQFDPATQVCAGGDGRDSCSGDSGGPLLTVTADGALEQIGIVSYGSNPCGQLGIPGSYTRVSAYAKWLASKTDPAPAPVTPTARVHIGRISCGRIRCQVALRVQGTVAGIRVGVRDRVAQARPIGGGRWIATLNIPYGHSTISASPLRADGTAAGRTVRVPVRVT